MNGGVTYSFQTEYSDIVWIEPEITPTLVRVFNTEILRLIENNEPALGHNTKQQLLTVYG